MVAYEAGEVGNAACREIPCWGLPAALPFLTEWRLLADCYHIYSVHPQLYLQVHNLQLCAGHKQQLMLPHHHGGA